MEFATGIASFVTGYLVYAAATFLVLPFVIVYILEDVAGRRSGERDEFLGAKVWILFLMSLAGQVFVAGLALRVALVLDEDLARLDRGSTTSNAAWGLMLGGWLAAVYPILYHQRIPRDGPAAVFRKAVGINGFLTGLVFTISLVVAAVLVCQDAEHGTSTALAITIVYGAATMVLGRIVSRGRSVRH